jgi:hypothetical protein
MLAPHLEPPATTTGNGDKIHSLPAREQFE